LVTGLTFFIAALYTHFYPKYDRLKENLSREFELTVKGASLAFDESVSRHIDYLEKDLDDAVSLLEKALIGQADELDGYLSRIMQGDSDVISKVSMIFEEAYKEYIHPAIINFENSYEEELARLEDGLLINLNNSLFLNDLQIQYFESERSAERIKNIIRSPKGLIIKVIDDAIEWVPLVGDAWGFLKIVYDPRKENIESKIREVTKVLEFSLKQRYYRYRSLTAPHVEKVCKDFFNGNYAVFYYLYLTYFTGKI
jgi:hypothetical protein